MRIDILTIFPKLFDSFLGESLVKKAIDKKILDVRVHDIRKWSADKHGKVDDEPFGGGAGMVMTAQPIADALTELEKEGPAKTVLLSPGGRLFGGKTAREFSKLERLILVCGRYEGVDERIAAHYVDEEISVGDYVLNGGEVAAMAVVESVFRFLPGAIGKPQSHENESHEDLLLEHPQYTRPEDFRGLKAPEILLSGHHANIRKWRSEKSLEKTAKVRPDLLAKRRAEIAQRVGFSIALVHYPVVGKDGGTIVSSITTLDIHDMARIGMTYSARKVYMVTPVEDQQRLVARIKSHWSGDDELRKTVGRRAEALELVDVRESLDGVLRDMKKRAKRVKILATSAAEGEGTVTPDEFISRADEADEWLVLFGTAYGLAPEVMERADMRLAPLKGRGEFNHLPVRGASAIILHRLFGN